MIKLTEKDVLQDVLVLDRTILQAYGYSLSECSCQKMRALLIKNIKAASEDQYNVWEIMNLKGYYPTEDAPDQNVHKAKQQGTQMQQTLN